VINRPRPSLRRETEPIKVTQPIKALSSSLERAWREIDLKDPAISQRKKLRTLPDFLRLKAKLRETAPIQEIGRTVESRAISLSQDHHIALSKAQQAGIAKISQSWALQDWIALMELPTETTILRACEALLLALILSSVMGEEG